MLCLASMLKFMRTHVFETVVDEVLTVSAAKPVMVSALRAALLSYYDEHVLFVTDDYPACVDMLYGFNDKKIYSILSLSFVDEYVFILMRADKVSPRQIVSSIINDVKKSNPDLTGPEIQNVVFKALEVKNALIELLVSSTRTSRKAAGDDIKTVVLPDMAVMQAFYECGRKVQYGSTVEAAEHVTGDNEVYVCTHCGLYHQGKSPTGQTVPQNIMEGRYRTAWRRYHGV